MIRKIEAAIYEKQATPDPTLDRVRRREFIKRAWARMAPDKWDRMLADKGDRITLAALMPEYRKVVAELAALRSTKKKARRPRV